MIPAFWIGFAIGLVVASSALLVHLSWRRTGKFIDKQESNYAFLDMRPRAITRIHSTDINWEIAP